MSMDKCAKCGKTIDTDNDEFCYGDGGEGFTFEDNFYTILCESCRDEREEWLDKVEVLRLFDSLGRSASYHYADDSTKEWSQGDVDMFAAMNLYIGHPDLREEMQKIAKGFLWSLNMTLQTPRYKDLA
jgi:hypothetical protein